MYALRILIFAGLLSAPTLASALDLSYTISGFGGFSQPQAPFGENPFPWIDWSGGVPGSALTDYGWNPVLPSTDPAWTYTPSDTTGKGSLLLSSPFTLDGTSALTVESRLFLTYAPYEPADAGFALLLKDGQLTSVLSNVTSWGRPAFFSYHGSDGATLVPTSPGVTTQIAFDTSEALSGLSLGGAQYGLSDRTGLCHADCLQTVTSTLTPDSGTYQLLFGVYNLYGGPPRLYDETNMRIDGPWGLAVTGVNVPEPSSWLLLGAGLAALAAWRRKRTA